MINSDEIWILKYYLGFSNEQYEKLSIKEIKWFISKIKG